MPEGWDRGEGVEDLFGPDGAPTVPRRFSEPTSLEPIDPSLSTADGLAMLLTEADFSLGPVDESAATDLTLDDLTPLTRDDEAETQAGIDLFGAEVGTDSESAVPLGGYPFPIPLSA